MEEQTRTFGKRESAMCELRGAQARHVNVPIACLRLERDSEGIAS